jgi:ribosome assembly protein YihI (activator of Der GTPase)
MKQFKTINQNKVDMEIGYKQEEPKIISDWLEQNRNPEIDKQVEKELEYLSKQETLEEVAERKFQNIGDRLIFEDGAKWMQERSYSEEDLKNAFLDGWQLRDGDLPFAKAKNKWFNEFKNK